MVIPYMLQNFFVFASFLKDVSPREDVLTPVTVIGFSVQGASVATGVGFSGEKGLGVDALNGARVEPRFLPLALLLYFMLE